MAHSVISGGGDFGTCSLCDKPANIKEIRDDVTILLCSKHRTEEVRRANFRLYVEQQDERAALALRYTGTPIVIYVHTIKNLSGSYVASVGNPINGCSPGFGSTPQRALRDLGKKIADEADIILERINEQAFEMRQFQKEFGEPE